MKKSHNSVSKFLCDYLPLIVFFAVYKLSSSQKPLIAATICMLIATCASLLICFVLTKKIPTIALVSGAILGIFGGLTVALNDELFIKIKPTIINLIFAAILFYGCAKKKPFLSYLLGEQIKMNDQSWLTLSRRWAWFFIFLAALNEVIWRNFPTDFWVQFKVFGMMPLSLIFALSQMPFMMKNSG